ncbi:hypothetical protein D918_05814 [Trichuris suis]|nr:hypothetical protein D918_05814 [Trichuris suis]
MPEKRRCELRAVTLETVANIRGAMQSCPSENEETAPPSGLTSTLMLHQRQALTWLLWREEQMPSGGILADDMGLGKTFSIRHNSWQRYYMNCIADVHMTDNMDLPKTRAEVEQFAKLLIGKMAEKRLCETACSHFADSRKDGLVLFVIALVLCRVRYVLKRHAKLSTGK